MDLFDELLDCVSGGDDSSAPLINPASGLPMIGGITGVDIAGNPYGWDDWLDESPGRDLFKW